MVNQHDHVKPFQEKENFERRQNQIDASWLARCGQRRAIL